MNRCNEIHLTVLKRPYRGFGSHLDRQVTTLEITECLYKNLMSNNFRKTAVF